MYSDEKFEFGKDDFDVVVTGPRRSMFMNNPTLRPYYSVPFGDMMIAGCFGMLGALADVMPDLAETIRASIKGGRGVAPWDNA